MDDITFSAALGETIGVIGENGAGKSTLLKIIVGTLTPSGGELSVNGRVAAILELGSGFHPEFTGRQNINLNASLMGLSRTEIEEKEPLIVDFADIGHFIDRPIKTYSSGMKMRLAFSIATSVDPDILVIDEALSVGDQRFQEKCIDRMMQFKEKNKTIVLCSHSMYLVNKLCNRTLWLQDGNIYNQGKTSDVISNYLNYMEEANSVKNDSDQSSCPDASAPVVIEDILILDEEKKYTDVIQQFQNVKICVKTRCLTESEKGHLGIGIERSDGQLIFSTLTKFSGFESIEFSGRQTVQISIFNIPISAGEYKIKAVVADRHALRLIDEYVSSPFVIQSAHPELGIMWMEHKWHL